VLGAGFHAKFHNSRRNLMDVKDVLVRALTAVEDASVPDDLRAIAFEKAVELISGRSAPHTHSGSAVTHSTASDGESGSLPGASSVIKAVAAKLRVPVEGVEEVYAVDAAGDLEIVLGPGRLESTTAGATKQIALLLAGGRQTGGLDDWTAGSVIRDACVHFGKFDTNNFARVVKQMDDVFSFRGKGQQWQVKINRVGMERLGDMIRHLAGAEP
jgi:hypothetical protein